VLRDSSSALCDLRALDVQSATRAARPVLIASEGARSVLSVQDVRITLIVGPFD